MFHDLEVISSPANGQYKRLLKLGQTRGQKKYRQVLIEGWRLVKTCLQYQPAKALYFCDNAQGEDLFLAWQGLDTGKAQPELRRISDKLFYQLAATDRPQAVLALVDWPDLHEVGSSELEALFSRPKVTAGYRLVICEDLQDPGNLGTIIRTAGAFGFSAILLSRNCVSPFIDKAMRSAMGLQFKLPIFVYDRVSQVKEALQAADCSLVATCMDGLDLGKLRELRPGFSANKNLAIMVGNEANGLSRESLTASDFKLTIPMPGGAESLNVGVAFAVVAFGLSY